MPELHASLPTHPLIVVDKVGVVQAHDTRIGIAEVENLALNQFHKPESWVELKELRILGPEPVADLALDCPDHLWVSTQRVFGQVLGGRTPSLVEARREQIGNVPETIDVGGDPVEMLARRREQCPSWRAHSHSQAARCQRSSLIDGQSVA
jgi:hypothetical protein